MKKRRHALQAQPYDFDAANSGGYFSARKVPKKPRLLHTVYEVSLSDMLKHDDLLEEPSGWLLEPAS
jgi:hypothetical protein